MHNEIMRFLKITNPRLYQLANSEDVYGILLIELIGFISQEYFCASWASGIEYDVFDSTLVMDKRFGYDTQNLLIDLFYKCDGWPCWDDKIGSPVIITADKWREKYEIWLKKKNAME